jgi:cysteine desulfurase family protein
MIYFDNAATTYPKPRAVYDAIFRAMTDAGGNPGRSAHQLSIAAASIIYDCRCELADFFGCSVPENVIFTYNTTYALNMAIKGLLVRGDHVLISNYEHNSVLRPVAALAARGVTYDVFDASGTNEQTINSIKSLVKRNTAAIVCTHVSNVCGLELPISQIGEYCSARHIKFIVDAAQSAGVLAVDMRACHIDALCIPGHKGLYGISGCGAVIFSESYNENDFPFMPTIEGGSGVNSLELDMPPLPPERFEAGTLCVPAIAALLAGVREVKRVGIQSIAEHENRLKQKMCEMFSDLPEVKLYRPDCGGGTLSFNVNGKPASDVAGVLGERGICVRSGFHCAPLAHKALETGPNGSVRASFSMYNNENEVRSLVLAVKNIIGK